MRAFPNGVLLCSFLLTTAVSLGACSKQQDPQLGAANTNSSSIAVTGAGATFPQPLYDRWWREIAIETPDLTIQYESVGSGEGIKRFLAEQVDFGASDAALRDSEIAEANRGVHLLPMTGGLVVLAYNIPGLGGELRLPRDVYVDIFLGNISRWNDPRLLQANPTLSLPDATIQTVARRDSSGTTFAFTNHLGAISETWDERFGAAKILDWPGIAVTGSGNEGVAQKIKITQNSIGYLEYGFARRLGLPTASLQNRAGTFVAPNAIAGQTALASAGTGDDDLRIYVPDPEGEAAYPIVTYTWLMVQSDYADNDTAKAVRTAVVWALNNGQGIAEEMGYIPLPDTVRDKALEIAELIK